MENFFTFMGVVFIIFGILQIILFFKMWGMTDDVNKLVKHFCKDDLAEIKQKDHAEVAEHGDDFEYTEKGDMVIFSNGLSGEVKAQFGRWVVPVQKGEIFHSKEEAIKALYKKLTE